MDKNSGKIVMTFDGEGVSVDTNVHINRSAKLTAVHALIEALHFDESDIIAVMAIAADCGLQIRSVSDTKNFTDSDVLQ